VDDLPHNLLQTLAQGSVRWWLVQGQREVVAGHRRVCRPVRMNDAVCPVQTTGPIFLFFNREWETLCASLFWVVM
jgi:hypothetical protein